MITDRTVGFGDAPGGCADAAVRPGSLLDCPEADAILRELRDRVAALESVVASLSHNREEGGDDPAAAAADVVVRVTLTSEERSALEGLPSSVGGLVRCLARSRRDDEPRRQKVITKTKDDATEELRERRANSISHDARERRASVNLPVIPRELLLSMDRPTSPLSSLTASSTAAHLAHEYGGAPLPRRFTEAGSQRRSLRVFARAVSRANSFVGQARIEANFGRDELEYLPREFTRLGSDERRRLARMLSWRGLRGWGMDMFEVERLSAVTVFQKGSSRRLLDDPDEGDAGGESSEGEEDCVEGSRRGCPLVLVGWALLSSPYAQLAMAKNVDDEELIDRAYGAIRQRSNTMIGRMARRMVEEVEGRSESEEKASADESEGIATERTGDETKGWDPPSVDEGGGDDAWSGGYFFPDEFEVEPRAVCHFLRRVEREYHPREVIPYHNNVHAADVLQSTHALIQMAGGEMPLAYAPSEIYSTLLAAALHDVRHPGNNNNYEVNRMSELSLRYHDKSVLENMHACRASCLLEGLEEKGCGRRGSNSSRDTDGGNHAGRDAGGIAGSMTKEQRKMLRTSVAGAILSTDMSHHFSDVAAMKGLLEALEDRGGSPRDFLTYAEGGNHRGELRDRFLPFLLHLADISNPAKPLRVAAAWSDAVYDEFFLQGDREAAEGLPVSPLCDRATTNRPEAQLGFVAFVVRPAFALLARCVPGVEDAVMGHLEENFGYWTEQKEVQN